MIRVTKAPAPGTQPTPQGVLASTRSAFQRFLARVQHAVAAWVPAGYEDENGFHYGEGPGMSETESR
ncbi:MAG TPA: hypothetical protein PLH97_02855 [Verrucomicrobiota bacterium]|nr:hypothetical protein [Verrucomicrobiota bacterium]